MKYLFIIPIVALLFLGAGCQTQKNSPSPQPSSLSDKKPPREISIEINDKGQTVIMEAE